VLKNNNQRNNPNRLGVRKIFIANDKQDLNNVFSPSVG